MLITPFHIIATVGVVAYNGYTGAVKKTIARSNHSTVAKIYSNRNE
tara:strand:- start:493 stop:630 length:138 start_codon:yes stop_codon:yes gene_type:complete